MTDEHEAIEMLIPWYVTQKLDDEDVALVEGHLRTCAACRQVLDEERQLKGDWAALPVAVPIIPLAPARPARRRSAARRGWDTARSTVRGWAARPMRAAVYATAQAAALLAVFMLAQPPAAPDAEFRTLSAADAKVSANAVAANAVVVFRPETREADFRKLLLGARARVVAGPTESGSYLLSIAPDERGAALAMLRDNAQVVLAQPLDGE